MASLRLLMTAATFSKLPSSLIYPSLRHSQMFLSFQLYNLELPCFYFTCSRVCFVQLFNVIVQKFSFTISVPQNRHPAFSSIDPNVILSYVQHERPCPYPRLLQTCLLLTDHSATMRIRSAIGKLGPLVIATQNLPARPVIRILSNSVPGHLLRGRRPRPDRAPPQNTLSAIMPLNASK